MAPIAGQGGGGHLAGVDDRVDGQQGRNTRQRLMNGHEADPQIAGGEHHHRAATGAVHGRRGVSP